MPINEEEAFGELYANPAAPAMRRIWIDLMEAGNFVRTDIKAHHPKKNLQQLVSELGLPKGLFSTVDFSNSIPQCEIKSKHFTVTSWNVERGKKLQKVLETIIAGFRESDIILLQEFPKYDAKQTFLPKYIAEKLDMDFAYATTYCMLNRSNEIIGTYGDMILSKGIVSDLQIVDIPSSWDWYGHRRWIGRPLALRATVCYNRQDTLVYSIHLENRTTPKERGKQMELILNDAMEFTGPKIIGGDFNVNFDGYRLTEPALNHLAEHTFCDLFGQGQIETVNRWYASLLRGLHISKVILDRVATQGFDIITSKVDNGVRCSDHYPIGVQIMLL